MPYIALTNYDLTIIILGSVYIFFIFIFLIIYIWRRCKNTKLRLAFYIALVIQIGFLFYDNYIGVSPFQEIDARNFEMYGWESYKQKITLWNNGYPKYIITPIYKLLKIRIAVIFGGINIILHMLINLEVYKFLKKIDLNKKNIIILTSVSLFFPLSLILHSGILREAIVIYSLILSLRYFFEYVENNKIMSFIKIFIVLSIGSLFHSAIIFGGVGYIYYFFQYSKQSKWKKIMIIILFLILLLLNNELFFSKIGYDSKTILSRIKEQADRDSGSDYTKNMQINNIIDFFKYIPQKVLYFLYSPFPWQLNKVTYIFSFMFNTLFYYYYSLVIIKNLKTIKKLPNKEKIIIRTLLISLGIIVLVFAMGTHNIGTAMRHRSKFLVYFLLIYGILKRGRKLN